MAATKTIHLIPTTPTTGYYIPNVPAVEGDYPADVAAELLSWSPPAFVIAEPEKDPAPAPSAETPADSTVTEV